jgi:hypothetical protein
MNLREEKANFLPRLNALMQLWAKREAEMVAWISGLPTGGPESDGRYPLSNTLGDITLVPCPAKLSQTLSSDHRGVAALADTCSQLADRCTDYMRLAEVAQGKAEESEGRTKVLLTEIQQALTTARSHEVNAAHYAASLESALNRISELERKVNEAYRKS